jgi:hypothetical protein
MCISTPLMAYRPSSLVEIRRWIMTKASPNGQLTAVVSWAMARIAVLDRQERYEDSFALTEEFGDWILGLDHQPDRLDTNGLQGHAVASPSATEPRPMI